jgi:hypothetical protein
MPTTQATALISHKPRTLFEVRDRGALAQMVAEPGAVAGRRGEIDFEERVQGAAQHYARRWTVKG